MSIAPIPDLRARLWLGAAGCGGSPLVAGWVANGLGGSTAGLVAQLVTLGVVTGLAFWTCRRLDAALDRLSFVLDRFAAGDHAARTDFEPGDTGIAAVAHAIDRLGDLLVEKKSARETLIRNAAHDLRSRLTALRSGIEAIQDGIRRADRETLGSLHTQTMALARIADDFRAVARLDAGPVVTMISTSPLEILDEVAVALAPAIAAAGIELIGPLRPVTAWISKGDPQGLRTTFTHLLETCLRRTEPGGYIEIAYQSHPEELMIRFDDTGPPVAPSFLAGLLRTAESEGGVATCAGIVGSQGGRLRVRRSRRGGLCLEMSLPRHL